MKMYVGNAGVRSTYF